MMDLTPEAKLSKLTYEIDEIARFSYELDKSLFDNFKTYLSNIYAEDYIRRILNLYINRKKQTIILEINRDTTLTNYNILHFFLLCFLDELPHNTPDFKSLEVNWC
ncbi:MAG: hypothetical protein ACFFG0_09665 [Candidatus Thorarchaeota archaeon]